MHSDVFDQCVPVAEALSALGASQALRGLLIQGRRNLVVHVQVDSERVLRGEPHPAAGAPGALALGIQEVRLLPMLAEAERVREASVALVAGVGPRTRVNVEMSHQRLLTAEPLGAERTCVLLLVTHVTRAADGSYAVAMF